IARRLEELPANRRVQVLVEVANAAEQQPLASAAQVQVQWVLRDAQGERLLAALRQLTLADGQLYAWVATEAALSRRLRRVLEEEGLSEAGVKAAGYWRLDEPTPA